jgi:pyruvate formate lyase activating enzyme
MVEPAIFIVYNGTAMRYFFLFAFIFLSSPSFSHAKEARYYLSLPTGDLQCLLCPRECTIKEGDTGPCRVRKNVKGKLESLIYGQACAVNIDPIEKKPFFHFLPASRSFSVATVGCTLRCIFCQNWSISQVEPAGINAVNLSPEQIVQAAKKNKCPSISYTYSEPTAFYEYMYDTAWLAKQHGIRNMMVTCGYISQEPLKDLCKVIDAANVDLKGFSDRVYRRMSAAKLAPVLETLKTMKEQSVWVEVGYLVIPTVNDSPEEIKSMTQWIATNLGPDVPLHFLRFFPQHKLTNLPPTPVETLEKACAIARESGLNYVYIGNVPGHREENTYCPRCKKMLIKRKGYFVEQMNIKNGRCAFCGKEIAGVWK